MNGASCGREGRTGGERKKEALFLDFAPAVPKMGQPGWGIIGMIHAAFVRRTGPRRKHAAEGNGQ